MTTKAPNPGTNVTFSWKWLQDMVTWIQSGGTKLMYDIQGHGGPYNAAGEGGVDLTSKPGTPVFALASGPVMGTDRLETGGARIGGVLSQRINVPGAGLQDIYYQHLDLLPQFKQCAWGTCGEYVSSGQQIGTTSYIGETEVGFNPDWGSGWGTRLQHPAPWSNNPESLISSLMGAGPAGPTDCQCPAGSVNVFGWCVGGAGSIATPCGPGNTAIGPQSATDVAAASAIGQVGVLSQTSKILQNLTTPNFWVRVGLGIAAIVLIVFALLYFIKDTAPAQGAKNTVEKSALVAAA